MNFCDEDAVAKLKHEQGDNNFTRLEGLACLKKPNNDGMVVEIQLFITHEGQTYPVDFEQI